MSDVSKTNELIDELRKVAASSAVGTQVFGSPIMQGGDLALRAASALEAATRVPVQGEPNGAVKAVIDRDVAIDAIAGGTISVPGGYGVLHGDDAANIVDAIIGHATVPDAATDKPDPCEMTHTPPFDFGQCETHDTTFPLGGACKWHGKESVAEVLQVEVDEQRGLKVRAQLKLDGLKFELADVVAVRDAALAAIERVRGLIAEWKHEGPSGPFPDRIAIDVGVEVIEPLLAALDGPPEPEWEYGQAIRKHLHNAMPEASREEAERRVTKWNEYAYKKNGVLVRRRPAGPWLPVEGESKP